MVDPVQQIRLAALLQSVDGAPTLRTAEASTWAEALKPGTRLLALVTAVLPDGSSVIDVEGSLFQTRLPAGSASAPGDRLRLIVVEGGARPTFSLVADTPGAPAPGARVELSALATQLKAVAEVSARAQAPVNLAPAAPVIPEPATPPAAWTQPLRSAIESSGMFYESHQAQWVAGQRPVSDLAVEPQAAFSPRKLAADAARSPVEGQAVDTEISQPAMAASAPVPPAPATTSGADDLPTMPPALATLVDRQLQTLATHQVHWTGTVWPGQTMDWTVEEDGQSRPHPEDLPRWSSRLRLSLPRLGDFAATLDLRGGQLQIRLAVDASADSEVRRALPALQSAMRERGLEIISLAVGAHDGT